MIEEYESEYSDSINYITSKIYHTDKETWKKYVNHNPKKHKNIQLPYKITKLVNLVHFNKDRRNRELKKQAHSDIDLPDDQSHYTILWIDVNEKNIWWQDSIHVKGNAPELTTSNSNERQNLKRVFKMLLADRGLENLKEISFKFHYKPPIK